MVVRAVINSYPSTVPNPPAETVSEYDDAYASCDKTYATLRIYTGEQSPQSVSAALGIHPTKLLLKDESRARLNGWLLSSEGVVESRDVRRHVDWIIEQISGVETALLELQQQPNVWMDVFCYWLSSQGQGGPSLNPKQMECLARLNLKIGFDCY